MAFSVSFTKRADGQFQDIYKSVGDAVRGKLDAAIERIKEVPYPRQNPGAGQDIVLKLKGERGLWRIRCGDYRMVYRIEGEDVKIIRVAHRSEAYGGL